MHTKNDLAKKLAKVTNKSATSIIREFKKDEIEILLEDAHKKGLIGKHVYIGTPIKSRSRSRSRSRSGSSSSGKSNERRSYGEGYVVNLTKDELAIYLAQIRPESKSALIKKYSRDQLQRRVSAAQKQGKLSKHVLFGTPSKKSPSKKSSSKSPSKKSPSKKSSSKSPSKKSSSKSPSKKSRSKSRSKSPSKKSRRSQEPCKSYQTRNERGRCVNKPCKDGEIRDRVTKECRSKKGALKSSRKSRSIRKSRVDCKSYQTRNERGRCVNKPCKDGKIRDKVTNKCRKKKNSYLM
jgi:hypothetical protein